MNLRFYHHPRCRQFRESRIERPISVKDGRVALGRPPEKRLEIL